jgi:hypothetical protein
MKLLILSIYSKNKEYDEMLSIQRSYLHKFPTITTYFIDFRENQTNPIEVENDFIYVKEKDTFINITYKTIEAIKYAVKHIKFDYMIRTNMSTIINIPKLISYCSTLRKTKIYTGGVLHTLQWIDKKCGIIDDTYWGTRFISGTSIIMSYDVVSFMANHKSNITYDIIDDVAIGIFINKYIPSALYSELPYFCTVPKNIKPSEIYKKFVFFRNRAYKNRVGDVKNMKIIRNLLYKTRQTKKIKAGLSNPS